jgi:hypothetical protein
MCWRFAGGEALDPSIDEVEVGAEMLVLILFASSSRPFSLFKTSKLQVQVHRGVGTGEGSRSQSILDFWYIYS